MTTPSDTGEPAHPPAGAHAAAPRLAPNYAQMNTIMASDRTLMAWTRTALAQLSFSFTIVKVLEGFQEKGQAAHPHAPQVAGLVLAGLGMLSLALGGIQYTLTTRLLLQTEMVPLFLRAPAIMASLMFLIGLVLFISIAVRIV